MAPADALDSEGLAAGAAELVWLPLHFRGA